MADATPAISLRGLSKHDDQVPASAFVAGFVGTSNLLQGARSHASSWGRTGPSWSGPRRSWCRPRPRRPMPATACAWRRESYARSSTSARAPTRWSVSMPGRRW